ncbi:MAG: hypothetical protein B7Z72_10220 [Gemmatimonadetes bacterium 21-71-4]|nr:MAG: hypothetical protein B7Z72_10220 [Gemmatimonadetes bacterium 21-71-4]
MLSFLDTLCAALAAHDPDQIRRLLRHPLARTLPPAVRLEALAIARAGTGGTLPPVRALHFYYQTLQLLAGGERSRESSFDPPPAGYRAWRAMATAH